MYELLRKLAPNWLIKFLYTEAGKNRGRVLAFGGNDDWYYRNKFEKLEEIYVERGYEPIALEDFVLWCHENERAR